MRRGTGTSLRVLAGVPLLFTFVLASITLLGVSRASATGLVLADGRRWEMVSPPEKNNSVITGIDGMPTGTFGLPEAAADGDSFVYASNGAFAGSASAPLAAQYLAERGASGWSTTSFTPKVISDSYGLVGVGGPYRAFSADLSRGLLLNGNSGPVDNLPLANGAPEEYQNYYLQEELGRNPGGEDFLPVLLTEEAELSKTPPSRFKLELEGATPDLRHIVFASEAVLTPGASDEGNRNLYEWSAEEGLKLVSITPYAVLGENHNGETAGLHPISDNGSVVFFTDGADLYARVNGASPAIQVDSDGGPESGEGLFQTASSDGLRVFFDDHLRLTSDSTANTGMDLPDLYEYDLTSGQLTDLTVEDPLGANVKGVLGASEDGSYVYFAAEGALTADAVRRCCNLYVWHRGPSGDTTKLIGSLSPNDESKAIERRPEDIGMADDWAPEISERTSRVTADGLNVVFMSEENLTGYDNRNPTTGQREEEVYDYDAAGTGVLHCVSCDPGGAPPTGPSEIAAGTAYMASRAIYQSRVLSDEEGHARVFFESGNALVPQDTNGQRNVYEWEEDGRGSCRSVGGCVSLISSGTSGSASSFLDASESGRDVFFLTESELVPQDTDQLLDVYDAREGGGFTGPPASPPACEEEACAAPASQAPALGAPLSASYVGLANPTPPGSRPAAKVHGKIKPKKKERKKRNVRHPVKKGSSKGGPKKARRSARTGG
jgi:hypothetical protein